MGMQNTKTDGMFYACGTYFWFEMIGPDAGGKSVWIRHWIGGERGGAATHEVGILEIPLDMVLKFAEQYNKQHNKEGQNK